MQPSSTSHIMKPCPKLILASRSPRRRELLAAAGYDFDVIPPSEEAEGEAIACQKSNIESRFSPAPKENNVASRFSRAPQGSDPPTTNQGDAPPFADAKIGTVPGETPRQLVARLARQKAADVVGRISECLSPTDETRRLVLGCDTVAECGGAILGKPADRDDARAMLTILSGQEHRVLSGLCLWPTPEAEPMVRVAVTTLRMDALTPAVLDAYLAGGQWEGKAGAFGYQDGLDWVHVIEGSASNVVGLPMELLAEMIEELDRHVV
jgi:septum formation protein